jgi:hypothetical protein
MVTQSGEAGAITLTDADRSITAQLTGSVLDPFTMEATELAEKSDVRNVAMAYGFLGAVGGGIIARKRAEAGNPAIGKFLF